MNFMRLDKFLKNSRLIRRRPLAKQVADQGRIHINGRIAKASTKIAVGDEIAIRFGQTIVTIRVTAVRDVIRKEDATSLYEVIREEKINE